MAQYTVSKKKITAADGLWFICFSAVLVLSVWKVRYGYVIDDEAFYSTIPNRLSFGDIFFKDEWHLSQLSGFLTLPFVEMYHHLFNTNEGLLLYMRRCYLAVHTAVSAIIYLKLRGMKKVSSDLSSADNHPDILQFSAAVSSVLFYLLN